MPRVDQPKVLQTVVLYLDNQFENLPPKCEECIAKIHDGQYQAVNLKKLKGHDLYRAVVDHDTRLIFSRQKIHGQHVLLLIWIVNNHDYSKVPYFKPGVLEQFLEKNALAIEKVGDDHFEDLDDSDEIIPKAEKWEYKKSLHYDKACIVLSHDQLSIIETKPPLLITGMPGSGKTCVAFVAILEYVKQHAHENHHIVYITNSDNLAKHLQSLWQASTQVPTNRCTITFVAYNTFIQSSRAFSSTHRFVGLETFEAWFKNKNPNIAFADYYHECSIISICKELDEYLNFGARGSLLTCIDEKLALYRLCNEYNEYRNKNHLVDLNLDDFIFPREIDLVIADEAQDFSYPKIQTILTMAKNENHIFCGDGNQRLLKSVSNAPFIWQQLLKSDQKPTHCILKRLFRNPKLVQELSARVLKVKNHLIGGVTDSSEAIEGATCDDETRLGAIHWLNEVTQTIHDLCRSVDCAIIIDSEEQRAEAESLFNTLLIFTVDQIKGLQFPVIVLFNPFMKKIYREINKMIPDDLADKSFNHNRPKSKEDKTYYDAATELNRLYTKITRASVSVHIMQTHGHIPRKLLDYFTKTSTKI